jgi:hypothetical protein
MKLKEKMRDFCKSFIILLFIYLLCPTHDEPQGYYSRMNSFCAMPFYIIILFAFIIIFVLQ